MVDLSATRSSAAGRNPEPILELFPDRGGLVVLLVLGILLVAVCVFALITAGIVYQIAGGV